MNVSEILKNAAEILRTSGVADPIREAKSLLAFALGKNQTFLIAHSEYELSSEEENSFQDFIKRRANREPFQYIVGRQEFYGLDFAVTKDVLIPRPETEMIVETAVKFLRNESNPTFCEIGVGSGCIAVAVLNSVKTARAVGLDISERVLKTALQNAETHGVAERLELQISDVYENLNQHNFDLIASNPPYIPNADLENLQKEVQDFEPHTALTDGGDGLSIIEKIIGGAPSFLKSNGLLLIEIGIDQAAAVKLMFDERLWAAVEIMPDLQNIPRTVKAITK